MKICAALLMVLVSAGALAGEGAVIEATTGQRWTAQPSAARASALRPAPPPLSLPATLQRTGRSDIGAAVTAGRAGR